jgi:hypothetical protein
VTNPEPGSGLNATTYAIAERRCSSVGIGQLHRRPAYWPGTGGEWVRSGSQVAHGAPTYAHGTNDVNADL